MITADMSDPGDVRTLAESVLKRLGGIDVLVSHVGGQIRRPAGAIVHVSSGAARIARPASLAYSASKAALNAYSKGLASELGPHGIRVNVVSHGLISTSGVAEFAAEQNTDPYTPTSQIADSLQIPLGRAGTAAEAAELIRFLVSPAAAYVTGAQFSVDGGAFPTL